MYSLLQIYVGFVVLVGYLIALYSIHAAALEALNLSIRTGKWYFIVFDSNRLAQ